MTQRRNFIKKSVAGIAAGALIPTNILNATENSYTESKGGTSPFTLGIASYSLRHFNLEETLKITNRLGVKKIALKSMHLPLDADDATFKKALELAKKYDVEIYGGGVIYMREKAQVEQGFEYAKKAGMKTIIGVPAHDLLPEAEKMVKKYDITLAIHNHGPGDEQYPSPESIYNKIKNLDKRIGICMDIGHTQRIKQDPSEELIKYKDRIFDIHIKDVTEATGEGESTEMGRGVIDLIKFFKTVKKIGYKYNLSLEYEKLKEDPVPGMAESIGYSNGLIDVLS